MREQKKYLYLIYRTDVGCSDSDDQYDSAVVVAASPAKARKIHPSGDAWKDSGSWVDSERVSTKRIGIAGKSMKLGSVVVASFNAG